MEELEKNLKELILTKYGSLNKFSEKINMPWTTLDSVLKRGINKSNVSSVIKICKELEISADELAKGNIICIKKNSSQELNKQVQVLQRAAEDEQLTDEELEDILSYAKFKYPNAFKKE